MFLLIATIFALAGAQAAPGREPQLGDQVPQTPLAIYRAYVKTQADSLVGMTKVLAREIADGNIEAAQSAYAPAHRYLMRLAPVLQTMGDLERRMDAPSDASVGRESNPTFSGFHRIEYGLFSQKSTSGLSEAADRLLADARTLRERIAQLDVNPNVLVGHAARLAEDSAGRALVGDAERYARTDLWDIEANVDGIREIVALAQGQAPAQTAGLDRTTVEFAAIDALLTAQKDGCGFKSYDTLRPDERTAFQRPLLALAAALSLVHGSAATD